MLLRSCRWGHDSHCSGILVTVSADGWCWWLVLVVGLVGGWLVLWFSSIFECEHCWCV
jgi:hypothetical protein